MAVLTEGQTLPLWVRGQALVGLKVTSCSPHGTVRLAAGCEVHVAPKPRSRQQQDPQKGVKAAAAAASGVAAIDALPWLPPVIMRALEMGPSYLLPLAPPGRGGGRSSRDDAESRCHKPEEGSSPLFSAVGGSSSRLTTAALMAPPKDRGCCQGAPGHQTLLLVSGGKRNGSSSSSPLPRLLLWALPSRMCPEVQGDGLVRLPRDMKVQECSHCFPAFPRFPGPRGAVPTSAGCSRAAA